MYWYRKLREHGSSDILGLTGKSTTLFIVGLSRSALSVCSLGVIGRFVVLCPGGIIPNEFKNQTQSLVTNSINLL